MNMIIKTKVCSKCNCKKPSTMFFKNRQTPDGLQSYCKECKRKEQREYYHFRKEKKKISFCKTCGIGIGRVHGNKKFCKECRTESDLQHQSNYILNVKEHKYDKKEKIVITESKTAIKAKKIIKWNIALSKCFKAI